MENLFLWMMLKFKVCLAIQQIKVIDSFSILFYILMKSTYKFIEERPILEIVQKEPKDSLNDLKLTIIMDDYWGFYTMRNLLTSTLVIRLCN